MRWTDLPPDRDPADAGASVLPRGEWEDLRQRLERLPPGHPSRPGDKADADEYRAGEYRAGEYRAVSGPSDPYGAEDGRADEGGSPGRRGVMDNEAGRRDAGGGPRGHDAGRAAIPGRREPYRPWFTEGESPQPWFAADPGE